MTIDEMRALHERALTDADAKRTELRLVLASRYRELVGSSDEVIKMKERADELLDLVNAIPQIISKLADEDALEFLDETKHEEKENDVQAVLLNDDNAYDPVPVLRRDLSTLPCIIYRALDSQDVHSATVTLIDLFTLIAQQTDAYPLATCLSREETTTKRLKLLLDTTTQVQIQMTFLQVQSLPDKIRRICLGVLARSASYDLPLLPITSCVGSSLSAAALVALDCLETTHTRGGKNNSEYLLTTYFESKAKLLASLLSQLTIEEAANAETVLSKIVLILQYDIVLHPYQIFCIRSFPDSERIIGTLPEFDRDLVKIKCSK